MATFVLIHGAGDSGWAWHLVAAELRARGHDAIAPDLPDDPAADLNAYADAVIAAVGDRRDAVVVGHSFGAFTAPLVAGRLAADGLVLVAGMVPAPGERPSDWWDNVGYVGSGEEDPFVTYYHDVPRPLAEEALRRQREHPSAVAYEQPWPLERWPAVPTRFVLLRRDRCFPAALFRRLVPQRLGITPAELDAGHCAALGRPKELADLLDHATWPE
ncbi:alpha/beta hydrolase [Dactylosporangium sp. NPDC000244]|uniref:alpha/beta fold hydrolase n=1 Tax=Dactylosporangium sp. NPDC000244 TaxID=3154365 RepID=UPI003332D7CA